MKRRAVNASVVPIRSVGSLAATIVQLITNATTKANASACLSVATVSAVMIRSVGSLAATIAQLITNATMMDNASASLSVAGVSAAMIRSVGSLAATIAQLITNATMTNVSASLSGTRECGDDPVCGQPCGDCPAHHECNDGQCQCVPDCLGRECGLDPVCGVRPCGICTAPETCSSQGVCCERNCTGRQCGPDPSCGDSCGSCPMYLVCEPNSGQCVPPYVDCNSGWCFIPAGTFLMGSPEDDPERYNNEGPTYIATITRDFYMSQTEVTQEQWESVFQNNPSSTTECGVDCPVETVNWFEAVAYANALSDKEGREKCYTIEGCSGSPGTGLKNCTVTYSNLLDCKGYRLPTETEWEYAARAGTSEPRYGEVDRIAWHVGNSQRTYHPVAKLLPNAWGLYDMLGNVWEWVHDYYDFYNTSISGGIDPLGPSWGAGRVRRGGGWIFDARNSRAADRSYDTPDTRRSYIGLRIVRTAP